MKTGCLILFALFSITMNAQELSEYRWKKRLVIMVSSNFDDSKPTTQFRMFKESSQKLEERDMVVLKIDSNSEKLSNFNIEEDFEGVMLVGKDGGLKAQYPYIVDPIKLFDLVDSMPMRRSEMRKKDRD